MCSKNWSSNREDFSHIVGCELADDLNNKLGVQWNTKFKGPYIHIANSALFPSVISIVLCIQTCVQPGTEQAEWAQQIGSDTSRGPLHQVKHRGIYRECLQACTFWMQLYMLQITPSNLKLHLLLSHCKLLSYEPFFI